MSVSAYVSIRIWWKRYEWCGLLYRTGCRNTCNNRCSCQSAIEKETAYVYKEILEKNGRFDALNKDLKETAIVRKENPEVTLLELADMLGVTKSCVNHRLRKLVTEAEKYKD